MEVKTKFKIGDILTSKKRRDIVGIVSKIEIFVTGEIITICYRLNSGPYILENNAIQLVEKI